VDWILCPADAGPGWNVPPGGGGMESQLNQIPYFASENRPNGKGAAGFQWMRNEL